MPVLSGLVCAHNEEARIAECLAGLSFCDEIVVVADRCTDRTEAIARQMGARVISGIFPIEGLRKAAGVASCNGQWILELDADEAVPPALAKEIRAALSSGSTADWYQVPVDNFIGERLVRHGWGGSFGASSVARLFRKGSKTWKSERVHPGTQFQGIYGGKLCNAIQHKVDDNIEDMFQRLIRYTTLRGQDLAESGKIKGLWNDAFRGLRRFFKCYLSRKGYREGDMGFLIAVMAGLYPLLSNFRAREIRHLNHIKQAVVAGHSVSAIAPKRIHSETQG